MAALENSTAVSVVVGPYTPAIGRPVMLTLSGTWTGSVQLKRSTDGGTNKRAVTLGGAAYGTWTGNINEPVWEEYDGDAKLYLDITRATGTVEYRIAQ